MSHFLWTEEQRRVEPAVFRNWQDIVYLSLNTLMKNRSVAGFQSSSSHLQDQNRIRPYFKIVVYSIPKSEEYS